MEKSFLETAVRKHYKRLAVTASFVLFVGIMGIFSTVFDDDEGVCEMFLSGGSMYYTDFKNTLYRYDNSSGKGEVVSKIEIRNGSQAFEDKGYIYYSNDSTIFRRSLGSGDSVELVKGKNIGMNIVSIGAVSGDKLLYRIAYKDVDGRGYFETEYRIYDLVTGKDIVLFKRSDDFWHFLYVDQNTVIADASLQEDSGLHAINLETGIKKKLSNMRVAEGFIANRKFYYTSQPLVALLSIDLNGGDPEVVSLPGMGKENFSVTRITGFGDFLYVAARYDGENHIIRVDLKTRATTILADGFGSIWELCTDGKTLYAYDRQSHTDRKGKITVIPLE
jgi:hypothetical protein